MVFLSAASFAEIKKEEEMRRRGGVGFFLISLTVLSLWPISRTYAEGHGSDDGYIIRMKLSRDGKTLWALPPERCPPSQVHRRVRRKRVATHARAKRRPAKVASHNGTPILSLERVKEKPRRKRHPTRMAQVSKPKPQAPVRVAEEPPLTLEEVKPQREAAQPSTRRNGISENRVRELVRREGDKRYIQKTELAALVQREVEKQIHTNPKVQQLIQAEVKRQVDQRMAELEEKYKRQVADDVKFLPWWLTVLIALALFLILIFGFRVHRWGLIGLILAVISAGFVALFISTLIASNR